MPESIWYCTDCDAEMTSSAAIRVGCDLLCLECYIERYGFVSCDYCGSGINGDMSYFVVNRDEPHHPFIYHCDHIRDVEYAVCTECGGRSIPSMRRCRVCGTTDSQGRGHNTIHDYSYQPPIVYRRSAACTSELFLGIELEITRCHRSFGPMDNRTASHREGLDLVPDWCYTKYDGSVPAGFEIVTHPMSVPWITQNIHELTNKFGALYDLGYRSQEGNICGMHIHMSKMAFSPAHLYKFMYMVYAHPSFTLLLSQRTESSLARWACHYATNKENASRSKCMHQGERHRHDAVNISSKPTIELRIFAGTLNPFTFYKNIETALALYRFSMNSSFSGVSINDFVEYVFDNKYMYRYLNLFLQNKEIRSDLFWYDRPQPVGNKEIEEYLVQTKHLIKRSSACAY